jgi:DNA polymerase-3 subunit gamma/tau
MGDIMAKKKSDTDDIRETVAEAPAKPYVVLARKYRPQTFDDLIGQEAMVQTLRNAFASGRIAHGYMLTGVRGVGKTTTARILARALNYETAEIDKPTIDMPVLGRHCAEIMESRHPDVIEMDAASNTGVDNIREIIESARYKPMLARTKVFIIDEVHMLSKGAFNALLKTLEEPPGHVKFIFATTEIRKVPVTVLSRCQRFDLRRVGAVRLAEHLKSIVAREGASATDEALMMIARAAEGSVRDALSILDQAIATSLGITAIAAGADGTVTATTIRAMLGLADRGRIFDLLADLVAGDAKASLQALEGLFRDGAEPSQVLTDLAEAVHITTRIKTVGVEPASEGLAGEEKTRAAELGSRLSTALLARLWQMLLKGIEETAKSPNPLAAAEMVLIRIAFTSDLPPPDEIIKALGGMTGAAKRGDRPAAPAASEAALAKAVDQSPAPRASTEAAGSAEREAPEPSPFDGPLEDVPEFDDGEDRLDIEAREGMDTEPPAPMHRPLNTFADVVALTGDKRDAKLKVNLEDHVSLVRFDAVAGAIDLFLLPGAPSEIANDLRERLIKWTGRRWVVMLSRQPGEPAIGVVRREREAAELAALKRHPAVASVLETFPGAEIASVKPIPGTRKDDDSATG